MGYSFPLRVAAPAGATPNILAGTAIEYMGDDIMLDVYGNGEITGIVAALTGFKGSEPGMQYIPTGSVLGLASTPGKVKTNEDFIAISRFREVLGWCYHSAMVELHPSSIFFLWSIDACPEGKAPAGLRPRHTESNASWISCGSQYAELFQLRYHPN